MRTLTGVRLSLDDLEAIASGASVRLGRDAKARMARSRAWVDRIVDEGRVVYGINTGFGKLSDLTIPKSQLRTLQVNLVRSHACGVGPPLSPAETRAMVALRTNVLALGTSGARPEVAEHLVAMLGAEIHPWIPESGSVGASGDLAPLAHLALAAIGEGRVLGPGGKARSARAALTSAGLRPLRLEAKEGLALLNGTQAMTAVGGLALHRALRCLDAATAAGAMTLEALLGTPVAFDSRIHEARGQAGQIAIAAQLRTLLDRSQIRESHRENDPRVQDAYCLRCMPQVHGAALDALRNAQDIVEIETGAATDNPLVFDDGSILSGGNFHGAPVALQLDFAAIAVTDLMSISERRIDRLVNPDLNEGLPPFLSPKAGVSSGFMIPHVTAAALLNEAKVLAHPASVDNVPTSGGKEDHVSMGMTSALKLRRIVDHFERVVAIELLAATEGVEYRHPLKPGKGVTRWVDAVRRIVPPVRRDRALGEDIERLAAAIRTGLVPPVSSG
ncbi:MAG TPA: histidine ammonia-lyase [Fimbriimonadaceae bacterium]|nr:histidine ammonia-lyase [Fimbriimonadaceae bacterium]